MNITSINDKAITSPLQTMKRNHNILFIYEKSPHYIDKGATSLTYKNAGN